MSVLKAVTHRLPWYVRDPAIKLIGSECYTTLVWNLDFTSRHCLEYALSKVLGLGIVLGGSIVKVPQIMKILSGKSARGLSLSSYILDTASLGITVAYNARNYFPWSTYGENVFLLVQNVIITALIILFSSSPSRSLIFIVFTAVFGASAVALSSSNVIPLDSLKVLAVGAIPLSLFSKIPQIISNTVQGSTGQLSAFLVFNSLAGCLARVFTTATETGDAVLWWGFVLAAALNGVLAIQMAVYWNEKGEADKKKLKTKATTTTTTTEKSSLEKAHVRHQPNEKSAISSAAEHKSVPSRKGAESPIRSVKVTSPPNSANRYVRKLD